MSRYVDISHFRAPYKNAVLQGLGAVATPKYLKGLAAAKNLALWKRIWSSQVGQRDPVPPKVAKPGGGVYLQVEQPVYRFDWFMGNKDAAIDDIRIKMKYGFRAFVCLRPYGMGKGAGNLVPFMVVLVDPADKDQNWFRGLGPEWQELFPLDSASAVHGLGASEAGRLWYYDENPAGKVCCFVPVAVQVAFKTLDNMNPAVSGPNPVHPTHVVWAIPQPQTVPGMDFATLVALPSEMPAPVGGQPAGQWLRAHTGSVVAWFSKTPGAPLDISVDGLKSGAYGLMASSSPQMIAGEGQPLPSAVFAGYDPVLPKQPAGGGGGGGEEPSKAGIGPLGIATIAVVVVGLGYLALKKK